MDTHHRFLGLIGLSVCLGLTACSRHPLEAEIPAQAQAGTDAREGPNDTILEELAGVRVVASVDDWPGAIEVFEHITPVRISIENNSDTRLRVRYQDFQLVAATGEVYHALPLYRIGGTVDKPVVVSDWDYTPDYTDGYYVAPYAAPLYRGDVLVYEDHYDYEPSYYDSYYRYWAELDLPTPMMVERSLPEGAVGERGRVAGWVYFERVPSNDALEPIILTFDVYQAPPATGSGAGSGDPGSTLGQIRLPFGID